MNGGDRRQEDWGFYPDLARQPGRIRNQKRLVGRGNAQQYKPARDRKGGPGPQGNASGSRGSSRLTAVVVLIIAAVVILATGIAMDQANVSGADDFIEWELLPLPEDTSTSPTG